MQAFLKSGKTSVQSGHSSATGKKKPPAPWVEKYRPKNVNDIVEQSEVVAVLRKCILGGDLPNMLLYGPPGTGKTSTILAAARQIFADMYKERILELNASDERGINIVRTKIKNFAQTTASNIRSDGKPAPPFKLIILDEADSMTQAAQAALRRTMEKESRNTRFCLVCNYVSRIIEPITSRCTKFRFKSLNKEKVIERLRLVCQSEGVPIDENAYISINEISGGDMRKAITTLQSCYRLKGPTHTITVDDLMEMSGFVPEKYFKEFLDITRCGVYSELETFVCSMEYEAYSIGQFLEQFNDFVLQYPKFNNLQKAEICNKLAECYFRIQDGGSEYLQIMNLGCSLILLHKQ